MNLFKIAYRTYITHRGECVKLQSKFQPNWN